MIISGDPVGEVENIKYLESLEKHKDCGYDEDVKHLI